MQQFKNLFTPLSIKGLEVRNRLVMLPMTTGYTEPDETVGDRFINFFAERAKGGVGLIIIPFSPVRAGSPVEPGLFEDRFIPGLRRLSSRLKDEGAGTAAQLITSYHVIFADGNPEIVAPSPVMNQLMRVVPRALTVDEIRQIVREYGSAARRAREGGFDAVEILVGGGYLLNRFLSPISNKREDEYGGDLQNRMRIILEVIESIKREAGADFPIGCRLNVQEQMPGGHTIEESGIVAGILEKAGIDVINAYTGWHESPVPTVAPSLPKGAFAHLAGRIKAGVGIPVIAANRINDPFTAEKIIAEGLADFAGMGRALLADPDLPNKARDGRVDEITPCLACSNCLSEVMASYRKWGKPVSTFCTVNPFAGKEAEYALVPAARKKRVFVVGGGPGGMEAAVTAASRGHQVTLFEKGSELGGRLLIAALPPFKEEIRNLIVSLAARARKAGVEIVLNRAVDAKWIGKQKPDVLVLATGADNLVPPIPGIAGPNVVLAEDVLAGRRTVGNKVAIVGGGMVGCETAEFLIERGVTQVTVLEMLERLAENVSLTYRPFFLARLKKEGVRMQTGATVTRITDKGVHVSQNGDDGFVEADTVVLAVGFKADPGKSEPFKGKAPEVYFVGDCAKARMIKDAIEEGFQIGRSV
ncbi:MAG: FAD-dependent oxidoreductase [Syntrophales bacterium]|nr:FAD-dependent oxidoreductase [Syntrophales bacterium]MDD5232937.1 FAD-dependent oxidoreductase [Syntrophales bacterium]MDD5532917.1 FAD-dependent oxidoreductase [Syntrophales bacterium]HPL64180.1 FAD-dependent oxidoreductase [Syntrophales bacterium]